ncbi:hypothetical protein PITCH_A880031 [uncultured Desulfobacterium sp.]|uniref:Uncharacterized protein n=1 Tax=uncultured Desulfobacterium sp. TaxID=201089 RepID=A0A445N3J7_9BACT|nr:hypothetical protein PITCH_A880031 [uncultured Desulfobacterium sp.]
MAGNGCGRHLSACHSVYAIVYKDYCNVFSPVCSMDGLCGPYGRNIAVTLIREDNSIRQHPFYPCSQGRASAVGGLSHIHIQIIICKYSAASWRDAYHPVSYVEFFEYLCKEAMNDAMPATGAVMKNRILEIFWFSENLFCHLIPL